MGHGAEFAAAVLNETKELPHTALTVSAAEWMIVPFITEFEDKEVE
jgi:hypothetical protein